MVERKNITAIIRRASYDPHSEVVRGFIEADTDKRFKDGTIIRTSKVTGIYKNVVHTRNFVYFVTDWLLPPP